MTVTVIFLPEKVGCRKASLSIVLGGHVSAIEGVKDGIRAHAFHFQRSAAFNLIS